MKELTIDSYVITNKSEAGCPTCRKVFASDKAFDRHRVGTHGEGRNCSENLNGAGLELSSKGTWRAAR